MTSIGFIGGGKMAEAIIKGLIAAQEFSPKQISVFDTEPERLRHLSTTCQVQAGLTSNQQVIEQSDVVVLAIKPQQLAQAIKDLNLASGKLVLSIAAGITLKFLEKQFPATVVIRAMPNNPALVGQGITALAAGQQAKAQHLEQARQIFQAVGQVVVVEERAMDAVTGLSGSGPAFVYLFIEALAEAGKRQGLSKAVAEQLALQTVLGSAATLKQSGRSAKELRQMVTSPGGTTIEGLKVLEKKKFAQLMAEAVKAAADKSKKLSQ